MLLLTERDKQAFLRTLQERLTTAVDTLADQDVSGSVTVFGGGLRVVLNRAGMAFRQTYTDLFYNADTREIRCSTLNCAPYMLRFCVTPGHKAGVTSTRGATQMDADQAAQHIIGIMLDVMNRK
jgi:hypothetical protein